MMKSGDIRMRKKNINKTIDIRINSCNENKVPK